MNTHNILRKTFALSFVLVWLLLQNAFAQLLNPVQFEYSTKKVSANEVELLFTAHIQSGWHLYSQFLESGGPLPTEFHFPKDNTYKLLGKTSEPKATVVYDDMFQMDVAYFSDKVTFRQRIRVLSEQDFTINGTIDYMVCNSETCVPFNDIDFSFTIKGCPQPVEEDITETPADSVSTEAPDTVISSTPILSESTPTPSTPKTSSGLLQFFFIAFAAGLLTLLTPCVFPVIPMTVSFFIKQNSLRKAFVYGLSIIGIFTLPVLLLSLITFVAGSNFITADFANTLSTHWLPNLLFFSVFFIFALSFLGAFEITLPASWQNSADKKSRSSSWSVFFMAFTLVLVSFSCTGPIVGTVLVESISSMQGNAATLATYARPTIGMLGYSLGIAIPFTLFAMFPKWLQALPKSGSWLNTIKTVLGFVELALSLKFLSVADQAYHWHLLDREVYLALWIAISFVLGLYLLGRIKLKSDPDHQHIGVGRLFSALIAFAFALYLLPGMFGAPLTALSGYIPPKHTLDFDLSENRTAATTSSVCEQPLYGDILSGPAGLDCFFDYEQGMKCAKEQHKPVFIDFTGHGCVNCREMESRVLSHPQVQQLLKENFVVISLYVDDKTELPPTDYVTGSDGKLKKTIGKKYADFQISRFGINAQPYYVLLNLDGELLTTPQAYDRDVNHFIQFLQTGLHNFALNK